MTPISSRVVRDTQADGNPITGGSWTLRRGAGVVWGSTEVMAVQTYTSVFGD